MGHYFHTDLHTIRVIKLRLITRARGHVPYVGDRVYKFWWENLKENYFGRPGCRWQDNIKMNLKGMGLEGNWMHVTCVNTGGRLL